MNHWIVRAMFLIPAGATATVLVAWACARWGTRPNEGDTILVVPADSVPEHVLAFLQQGDPSDITPTTTQTVRRAHSISCTRLTFRRSYGGTRYLAQDQLQFGLPFRAMEYVERSHQTPFAFPSAASWRPEDSRGGWPRYAPPPVLAPDAEHVYPLTVLPLGFTANTVIYAGLVAALLVGVPRGWRGVRQWRNRGRGLCAKCGYPRGPRGLCPECGTRWE